MTTLVPTNFEKYWQYALWLALFTILYNFAEGLVSVYFGAQGEALTLLGFGMDSFIEVMSGIGILAMVLRIRRHGESRRGEFERAALRVTGWSFFLLAAGLASTALYNMVTGHRPTTTLPGIVIAVISIAIMWALVRGKLNVGNRLDSAAILADASCTMVCVSMSAVLLTASLVYQLTGFGFVDSLGAIGLIYFSAHEGKESLEKAAGRDDDED